jgi:RNA polymerase I-specific transcription initiation factor RRN7
VAAIIKLWSLPPEFEAISRDVWSLALTLKGEISHIDSGNDEHERGKRALEATNTDKGDSEGGNSESEGSESESSNAGIIYLLDRLSEDDESDAGQLPTEPQPIMRVRGKGFVSRFPCYITVAVLLVSCWILRLPVIYSDILK